MKRDQKCVLYIGGFELPDKNAAAQRVVANAKIFRSLGYTVIFIGIDRNIGKSTPLLSTEQQYEGFTYYSVSYPKSLLDWISYLGSIKNVLSLSDLSISHIIAYNYPGLALLRLSRYCRQKGISLIGDCTEWYEAKGNFIFSMIKGLDVYLRMKIAQPKLDGLIVISDYLYNYYQPKIKNIVNIPPLVDLLMDKWTDLDHEVDGEIVKLIYAGSPSGNQKDRLDKIVEALDDIKTTTNKKFVFTILGLTEADYIRFYGDSTLSESSRKFLIFMGRVPHLQVLKEISTSDFEIFIRYNNLTNTAGFPTKFVEAISCGTPVLSNSSSNITQYLLPDKTGYLLNAETDEDLKHTLLEALNTNKATIKEMKEYCRTSRTFDFRNYDLKFKSLLNNIYYKSL